MGVRDCPQIVWSGDELDWVDPKGSRLYLRGVGDRYLRGPEFEEAHRKLLETYKPPHHYQILLFIPCSYGKPYSQSYIHYFIRRTIRKICHDCVHEVILTNAGVVPRELDEYWPYTAYDWSPLKETPEIRRCYIEVLAQRITDYLKLHMDKYDKIASYLRWDSDSLQALHKAAKNLGLPEPPNLAARPHEVPRQELLETSLDGVYLEDPDVILVTPTSLSKLEQGLKQLLNQ